MRSGMLPLLWAITLVCCSLRSMGIRASDGNQLGRGDEAHQETPGVATELEQIKLEVDAESGVDKWIASA